MSIFICLGNWQLTRAKEKYSLIKLFHERASSNPLPLFANDLKTSEKSLQFYHVKVTGFFDNQHTLLLDNKIYKSRVGYEIYTPFHIQGLSATVLVDRGFILANPNRKIIPNIVSIEGEKTISGLFNFPPRYVALGQMQESSQLAWPLRIEYIHRESLAKVLKENIFPYVLILSPQETNYPLEWEITTIPPERHKGYALQWFAFALTLLILCVFLNIRTAN